MNNLPIITSNQGVPSGKEDIFYNPYIVDYTDLISNQDIQDSITRASLSDFCVGIIKTDSYEKHMLNKTPIIMGGKPRGFKNLMSNVLEDVYNPKPRVYNELDPYGEENWE
jgi:hypothetical protein